jgi:hypothetical protein
MCHSETLRATYLLRARDLECGPASQRRRPEGAALSR